jgi:hypothetical protein
MYGKVAPGVAVAAAVSALESLTRTNVLFASPLFVGMAYWFVYLKPGVRSPA